MSHGRAEPKTLVDKCTQTTARLIVWRLISATEITRYDGVILQETCSNFRLGILQVVIKSNVIISLGTFTQEL